MKTANGFTLMEVMIALLISAISLLGLAALQGVARKNLDMSFQYSQASLLLEELAERMRANPAGLSGGLYNAIDTSTASGSISDCSAGCAPATIAANDILGWSQMVKDDNLLSLAIGKSQLNGNRVKITLMWNGQLQRFATLPTTCPPLDCIHMEVDVR